MTPSDQSRVLIDNSEFVEALKLMLLRRESAAPAARRDIDDAVDRLKDGGDVATDRLRICWHETTQEGDTVVHITAGPTLLELALPSDEETD